jgi:hypothetical protein
MYVHPPITKAIFFYLKSLHRYRNKAEEFIRLYKWVGSKILGTQVGRACFVHKWKLGLFTKEFGGKNINTKYS